MSYTGKFSYYFYSNLISLFNLIELFNIIISFSNYVQSNNIWNLELAFRI